jgi:hypothetical protein
MAFPVAAFAPAILSGLGALFGSKERKPISAEELARLFGPQAISADTNELFNMLRNSPMFSQIMSSMGIQGNQLGNAIKSRVAASGAGGSPVGAFAAAAGSGYSNALQRGAQGQLFEQALRAAMESLQQRAGIWSGSQMQQQSQPTFGRMIGSSLLNAGAQGFSSLWGNAGGGGAVMPLSGYQQAINSGFSPTFPGYDALRPLRG